MVNYFELTMFPKLKLRHTHQWTATPSGFIITNVGVTGALTPTLKES